MNIFLPQARVLRGCVSLLALAMAAAVHADTLALYQFTSGSAVATSSATQVTASAVTMGITAVSGSNGFSSAGGNVFFRVNQNNSVQQLYSTESLSVEHNDYYTFTLTPDAGTTLNLSQFTAMVGGQSLGGASSLASDAFTAYFFLRSSLDGYTSNLASIQQTVDARAAGASSTTLIPTALTADLGSEFSSVGSSVSFRIYAYVVTTTTSFDQVVRMDDFTVLGAVSAIPEPANLGLVLGGLALVGLALRRRTFRR
ncbi:MAG: PEP-CTERM sorting domain-containing protein [Opitutaceae bacterium]